jgi:hypothetical protein
MRRAIRHRVGGPDKEDTVEATTEIIRNGVNTEQLFGTLDAIKADPSLAKFQLGRGGVDPPTHR